MLQFGALLHGLLRHHARAFQDRKHFICLESAIGSSLTQNNRSFEFGRRRWFGQDDCSSVVSRGGGFGFGRDDCSLKLHQPIFAFFHSFRDIKIAGTNFRSLIMEAERNVKSEITSFDRRFQMHKGRERSIGEADHIWISSTLKQTASTIIV